MKQLYTILLIIISTAFSFSQSQDQNYVVTMTPQVAKSTLDSLPTEYEPDRVLSTVNYFDGLGRSTQSIQYKASPTKKDIISFTEYDGLGRVSKEYLPYTSGNTMNYRNTVLTDQSNFYQNATDIDHSTVPFAEKLFDGSPLNRVIEQGAPGDDWQLGTDHTTKSEVVINGQDEILQYAVTNSGELELLGYWLENQLIGTRITDEHGKSTIEYKDKVLDRVYVKRVENEGGYWHDTYYVYNDIGQLAYVLPPMFISESLGMSNGSDAGSGSSGGSGTTYADYLATFACIDFLTPLANGTPSCTGDVTVDINNDFLTITFDIPSITNANYKNGLVAILNTNPVIPDINFGSLPASTGSGQLYSQNGDLYISAIVKGSLSSVNHTFTHDLSGGGGGGNSQTQPEDYPDPLISGLVSSGFITDWTYQYKYDQRGRMIAKKLPGKEWELIVYNEQNLPILTQDGELRNSKHWLFTKYDAHDRPIATGKFKITSTTTSDSLNTMLNGRATLQTTVINHNNQSGKAHWEQTSTNDPQVDGYTNKSYPTTTNSLLLEVYSINYYDDYDFDHNGSADYSYISKGGYTSNVTTSVKGQLTASKIKVLDLADPRWTFAVSFYDKYGRVKQTRSWNAIGKWDVTWNEYDFTGKIEKTFTERSKSGLSNFESVTFINPPSATSLTEERNYDYDHAGRLLRTTLALDGDSSPELLAKNQYNELGELIVKKVGNTESNPLQTVDYRYNIRGWLTEINDPLTLGDDLFAMNLLYNQDHVLSGNAQYNGNISGYEWKSAHDNVMRNYGFAYDGLNRLQEADYTGDSKEFDVPDITYDRNGNILSLTRRGMTGTNSYGLMDDLNYDYGNGNQIEAVHDADTHTYQNLPNDWAEFKDLGTTDDDYDYDDNGNMSRDANKQISSILYNHLNLPTKVTFNNSQPDVEWVYDAAGMKIKKKSGTTIKWYVGGVEYKTENASQPALEAIYHEEGRVTPDGSGWQYEYTLSDHLGNARVSFADSDNNGSIDSSTSSPEILQTQSYYPFGLTFSGIGVQVPPENPFQFQGQEIVSETGWSSFKWRNADPTIGRFFNVDPIAEDYYYNSTYAFSENAVIAHVELEGLEKVEINIKNNIDNSANYTVRARVTTNVQNAKQMQVFASVDDLGVSFTYNNDNNVPLQERFSEVQIFDATQTNAIFDVEFDGGNGIKIPDGIAANKINSEIQKSAPYSIEDILQGDVSQEDKAAFEAVSMIGNVVTTMIEEDNLDVYYSGFDGTEEVSQKENGENYKRKLTQKFKLVSNLGNTDFNNTKVKVNYTNEKCLENCD